MEVVKKGWGKEAIIENNELYCGKILVLDKPGNSSYHYHPRKDETFYIQTGMVEIVIEGETKTMVATEKVRIKPGTKHQFRLYRCNYAEILEISTPHREEDVVRKTRDWQGKEQ